MKKTFKFISAMFAILVPTDWDADGFDYEFTERGFELMPQIFITETKRIGITTHPERYFGKPVYPDLPHVKYIVKKINKFKTTIR